MTSTTFRPNSFQKPPRDPNLAALLSLIPGLGQLYNGETRKGFLFLTVTLVNSLLLIFIICTDNVLAMLLGFGQAYHIQPNRGLVDVMETSAHIGSPASFIYLALMFAFVVYAMRDAYDHAAEIKKQRIYPEHVIEMSEATSSSYLFHYAIMAAFFITAFFFLIPPPPKQQVTDIEFIENQPPTKKIIHSEKRAAHASENAGKHNPKQEVRAPSPAPKAPSKASTQSKPAPQPTPKPAVRPMPSAHPTPTPAPHPSPTPAPHPSPTPSPHPAPTPSPHPSPTPSLMPRTAPSPMPMARPSAHPSASPAPSPSPVAMARPGGPVAAPSPHSGGLFSAFAPSSAPSPIAFGGGGSGPNGAPSPQPITGGGGGGSTSKGTSNGAPAPTRIGGGRPGGGFAGGGPIAVAPSVPRASGGGGGEGVKGNPDANSNPNGAPSEGARADVDFGPYMADLQRRIKRAWFPPKGNESKRVVVVFKVHKGGELSHLRLDHSSGVAIADQAALKAVETAAPFRQLPPGAGDDVDIQFTFDYNVFGGGGHGTFRQF